jgi:hypothetical protein
MDRYEAESKLKYYHEKYGDLVYMATPEALREHARDFRAESKKFPERECEQSLLLLVQSVQYEAVAQCRDDLGENWVSPIAPKVEVEENATVRSMSSFRKRQERKTDPEGEPGVVLSSEEKGDILAQANVLLGRLDEEMEPEFFTLVQLTQEAVKPRFKIGDPCWVCDWHEDTGDVIGYVPGTVTGLECYPDEVYYMIGFLDEVDGLVTTNFETVSDEDIFHEMPDEIIQPGEKEAKAKKRSHLSVVK